MKTKPSKELSQALNEWLNRHPKPDEPTIYLLGRSYSPKEIVDQVQQGTTFGQRLLSFLATSAEARHMTPTAIVYDMAETNARLADHGRHNAQA